ncbi:MAG TPA: Gfo/Idh/MocA family oxidoreductase [Thermomicrobiales bacterium]|nr:Gfo/Idh/MocA family oxidoreductase [Thermomicrobiales bacterium]
MSTASKPVGIGIVGAGVISEIYLKNLSTMFAHMKVIGVADVLPERAEARAREFGLKAMTVDELLAHPEIELVVNLTIPAAHAEIAFRALEAGKSIYNEKPLAIEREDGRRILELAKEKGLRAGSSPDTFLGGGLQMVRKLLDEGVIGAPVAVNAALRNHGMEHWHPDPFFFFQPGAGPLFDVGVYYVTALTSLLGPFSKVAAMARASFPERTITNGPKNGEKVPVTTPTHIVSAIEFESGVIGTLTASFDVWETDYATLVIYGEKGTIRCPDPNMFGGPIYLLLKDETKWHEIPVELPNTENSRGLGAADLARAIRDGGPSRVDGELGYHVLDVMHAVLESAERGEDVAVESRVERPAPMDATAALSRSDLDHALRLKTTERLERAAESIYRDVKKMVKEKTSHHD